MLSKKSRDGNGRNDSRWPCRARIGVAVALLLGGLSGCGGGGGDDGSDTGANSPTPSPVGQVTAVDGFGVVRPGVATRVDLSAFVRGPEAALTSINSEQPGCRANAVSELSVEVTNESGLCEFTYKVSNQNSDASAVINVLASSASSPLLPPLSQTLMLGTGDATYDLQVLLGADWPAGYSLDPNSLEVQGGTVQGTATASGNSVTYTPSTSPDWNRIVFILTNPAKPGEDALGTLYVTVSDSTNQAPVIGQSKYDYNAKTGNSVVTQQLVTLDLATLPSLNITEPDGDEWQLVEVQSYSASVTPVDPNSVTNKKFTFQAGLIGEHIVSYIVGDHRAGFTAGLIKINVGADEHPKTWANITVGAVTYHATPLYSEVINQGVIAEGLWDNGVSNTIAGVSNVGGSAYCRNGKRLATKAELDTLRATPAADTERNKYPVQRAYLASNGMGGYLSYNLETGADAPYTTGTNLYVMCVSTAGGMMYVPHADPIGYGMNTGLSDTNWHSLGVVTSAGGVQGGPRLLSSNSIGGTPLSDGNLRLEPAGCPEGTCSLDVWGDPTQYGNGMQVEVTNAANSTEKLSIGTLTLLQNARVTAARAGVNDSLANGVATNTVIVTVKDKENNLVVNTNVKLKYSVNPSANVTIAPASGSIVKTNSNGEAILSLKATMDGNYTITFPNDAVLGGLVTSP